MLLPVLVVDPDAIGSGQIVLFQVFEERVHRDSSQQMVVPLPGPVHRPAGHQPPTHKQHKQQSRCAVQHHNPAVCADFVIRGSVKQGHGLCSFQMSVVSVQLSVVSNRSSQDYYRSTLSLLDTEGRHTVPNCPELTTDS